MKRTLMITPLLWLVLWLVAGTAGPLTAAAPTRPNVLLVMTDDQGWGDFGFNGNQQIDTPVLDRLAAQSAHFTRFYVSPLCAPTRAALLTGRHHYRTGVVSVTNRWEVMRAQETTIAEIFQAAGYATGCFGKWHNGQQHPNHPNSQGFDQFIGFCGGVIDRYFDAPLEHNGAARPTDGYITDVLTDEALGFIAAAAGREQPFFCYLPYNAPHTPLQVPDRYFDKYLGRGLDRATAAIYGMCENIDHNLGRLLDRLDRLGIADQTVVLFLTDNGPSAGRYNGDMLGRKGHPAEGGTRTPLLVRWPGQLQPRRIDAVAAHFDVLPTLVDLCGLPPIDTLPLDGRSLVPLLRGSDAAWPSRTIVTHNAGRSDDDGRGAILAGRGSIRDQRWALLLDRNNKISLFDLRSDPGQQNDVADQHPQPRQRLLVDYQRWLDSIDTDPTRPPIPVGHPGGRYTDLPAWECRFDGQIRYGNGNGYTWDWLTGWTDTDDRIWWDVDVLRSGRYEVTARYACAAEDLGAAVRLSAGPHRLETRVDRAADHDPRPRPDRTDSDRQVHAFEDLVLGEIQLAAGPGRVVLQALAVPGPQVMELHWLRLRPAD